MKADIRERILDAVRRGDRPSLAWRIRGPILQFRSVIAPKLIKSLSKPFTRNSVPGDATLDEANVLQVGSFKGYNTASQSLQDVFVQCMTRDLELPHYLELGSGYPIRINNTFVLEHFWHWQGISVELSPTLVDLFRSVRANTCLMADATQVPYEDHLVRAGFPRDLGYLSVDIDPSFQSLASLLAIPFDKRRFPVITFEHDLYRSGGRVRALQREFLGEQGYVLVVADVKYVGRFAYEDWWVHPDLVPREVWSPFRSARVSPESALRID